MEKDLLKQISGDEVNDDDDGDFLTKRVTVRSTAIIVRLVDLPEID